MKKKLNERIPLTGAQPNEPLGVTDLGGSECDANWGETAAKTWGALGPKPITADVAKLRVDIEWQDRLARGRAEWAEAAGPGVFAGVPVSEIEAVVGKNQVTFRGPNEIEKSFKWADLTKKSDLRKSLLMVLAERDGRLESPGGDKPPTRRKLVCEVNRCIKDVTGIESNPLSSRMGLIQSNFKRIRLASTKHK